MYIVPSNFRPHTRMAAYLLNGPGRHRRRRGIRGMGDDSLFTNAPVEVIQPDSIQTPQVFVDPVMNQNPIASGQNYNPALNAFFNATPAQAAQMVANSSAAANAVTAAPFAVAPPASTIFGMKTSTVLLGGAGIVAALLFAGGSGKRRR